MKEDIVSSAERFVRHHKQQTNRAICLAYARLAPDRLASAAFDALLLAARQRARHLLDARVVNDHHPGVEALVQLSRFERAHLRPIAVWPGSTATWRQAVLALAKHLLAQYAVPPFLASCWYAQDQGNAEQQRRWFIAHAAGASFRSLDLPIAMTRKMEHIFLKSPDHLAIEPAMLRAELLALGAPDELVRAVLATQAATGLRPGDFWRTVWTFFIANANTGALDPAQVGPLIDCIQAIRHEWVTVETPDGPQLREPPQPSFSMKGRTMASMLRLMHDWHRSLGLAAVGTTSVGLTWAPSPFRPMVVEERSEDPSLPPLVWQLMELTNSAQLRAESMALHHCVARIYDYKCWSGNSRIWSLRSRRGDTIRHVLTIEIDMRQRAIIQARGWRNRLAAGKPLRLLQDWSTRERLPLASLYG
jgi:hypothetical protein